MNTCAICGCGRRRGAVCDWCLEIVDGASQYRADQLMLVVDGSAGPDGRSGAGIVLARRDERVLATVPVELFGFDSGPAEVEAIERAAMLAPGVIIWSDSTDAICQCMEHRRDDRRYHDGPEPIRWLPPRWRFPLHSVAHKLANIARQRNWRAYNNLIVPRRAA